MVVDETYFEPLVHPDFTTEQVDKRVKDLSLSAEADLHQEALDNLVYEVAGYIIGLAGRTPFEKQRGLVEFVVKLQEVVCHNDDGEELKSQGMVVWKELPTFGWEVRDKWNFDFKDLMDPKTGFEPKHAQECHNWASFLAQLTVVAHQKSVWDLDYSQFALWDLRSALEEQHPESEAVECRTYQTSAILQAAEWMLHAPEVIRDLCKEQKAFPDKVGRPGNKYFVEHPEWNGFNEERWRLWKGGFRDAQSWVVGDDAKKKVKLVLERIRDL